MLYRNLLVASGLVLAGTAHSFSIGNGSMTTQPGIPWVMPHTNYKWLLANGTETHTGVNQGDGVMNNNSHTPPLTSWLSSALVPTVTITGTVDVSQALAGSYLQIGLITRSQAERAFDWYASGMFNNSAMITFNYNGNVALTDNNPGGHTFVGSFGNTINFDVTFDLASKIMSTTMGGGKSRSFGFDNWYQNDLEDFSEYAILIQSYNEGTGRSTFSWQSVAVQADPVPEPFTMGLAGAALVAAIKRRRKARKA